MKRTFFALLTVSMSLSLAACGAPSDEENADITADSSDDTSSTTALLTMAAEPAETAMTPEAAAVTVSNSAPRYLFPAGCATATASGNVVTYQINNCTGPHGLVNLNGTLTATYSDRTANGWTVRLTGDVRANSAQLRPDATAVVTYTNGVRTANVSVRGSGTGRRGVQYTRSGMYTTTWDGNCVSVNGAVSTTANGVTGTVTATNYRRCRGQCPAAGSQVAFSGPNGSVSVSFSGAASATFTGSRGRSVTVALFCAPATN